MSEGRSEDWLAEISAGVSKTGRSPSESRQTANPLARSRPQDVFRLMEGTTKAVDGVDLEVDPRP